MRAAESGERKGQKGKELRSRWWLVMGDEGRKERGRGERESHGKR
jgi:hypothetical protein